METPRCDKCNHPGYAFIAETELPPLPFCWLCGADIWEETDDEGDESDSEMMDECLEEISETKDESMEELSESKPVSNSDEQVKQSVETVDCGEDHDPFITMFPQAEIELELASHSFSANPVGKAPHADS